LDKILITNSLEATYSNISVMAFLLASSEFDKEKKKTWSKKQKTNWLSGCLFIPFRFDFE
jgi:hypothetical protein